MLGSEIPNDNVLLPKNLFSWQVCWLDIYMAKLVVANLCVKALCFVYINRTRGLLTSIYEARPQSTFPTRPTASKPYIARSDCSYVIEKLCSMAHALTVLPAFSQ
jgi:hypothetical protein